MPSPDTKPLPQPVPEWFRDFLKDLPRRPPPSFGQPRPQPAPETR